jgi:hypothetical protein
LVVLASCGGKTSAPAHPSGGSQPPGATPRPGVAPETTDARPTGPDRCDKLVDHVVTLAVAERPADQQPTADERTKIASQLRTSWAPKCEAMTNQGYDCAVAARTLVDLDRCGG